MNKLQVFTKRLQEIGLSERQIDEAVYALNEYNNTRFEEQSAQQGKKEANEQTV